VLIQALQSILRGAAAAISVLLILPLTSTAATRTLSASEQSLSAALTLRLTKFIDWPNRAVLAADIPYFIVGVYGSPATQSAFAPSNGKSSKGKTVKIVRIDPSSDPRDLRRCHVIYADAASDQQVILEMTRRSRGILTVFGPGSGLRADPCLRLAREEDKLAFDIDLRCTRRSDLDVDAGLIRLARNVKK
jgi:hypothetical protein